MEPMRNQVNSRDPDVRIGARHTRRQAAPQNLPSQAVIDFSRSILRERTLDNRDKLPDSLVLFNATEL